MIVKQNKNFTDLKNTVLPPEYMNLFEKTTDFFQNIISKCTNYINKVTKLQEEQQKRITPKFNEEENICLDNNISLYIMEITEKIKKCDELIKQLSCIKLVSLSENDMKNNMKIYLASKLQEISKKIRQNEEEYMNKYKEFGKNDFKQVYNSDTLNEAHPKPNSFLELNKSNDILRQRDNEINNIVRSISDLTQIFNDLGVLVKDQG